MVRPIRIPQRDTGLGAPAELLSAQALAAPARATADLAQTAAGAVAGVAAATKQKRDHLRYVREGAAARALEASGIASAKRTLSDYVQSPEYDPKDNDAAYKALRTKLYGGVYDQVLAQTTDPTLRAQLEGTRDGLLAADLGAELEQVHLTQDSLAISSVGDYALTLLEQMGPDGAVFVAEAQGEAIDWIVADRPELRDQAIQERRRIFDAIKATHGGSLQDQLRFQMGLESGDYDRLGLDVIGREAKDAAERSAALVNEIGEASVVDHDWGVLTESGGQFPVFTNAPGTAEIDALIAQAEDLPDPLRRNQLQAKLRAARLQRELRASAADMVGKFQNGEIDSLRGVQSNGELMAAYDAHLEQAVIPRLSGMDLEQQSATLARNFVGAGVVAPALQGWIQQQVRSIQPDPIAVAAIAKAMAAVDPSPLYGAGDPKQLRNGQTLPSPIDTTWLKGAEAERLRFIASRNPHDALTAAAALEAAINFEESQKQRSGAGVGGDLSAKAQKAAEKHREEVRRVVESISGGKVTKVGANQLREIDELTAAHLQRMSKDSSSSMSEEEQIASARDLATREFLAANPPVVIGGLTHTSKPIVDALDGAPPEAFEAELRLTLEQAGYGDLPLDQVIPQHEEGMAPGTFRLLILGEDGQPTGFLPMGPDDQAPARMGFNRDESVWQRNLEALRSVGMLEFARLVEKSSGTGGLEAVREQFLSASMLTREDLVDRFAASRSGALPVSTTEKELAGRKRLVANVGRGEPAFFVRPELKANFQRNYEAKKQQLAADFAPRTVVMDGLIVRDPGLSAEAVADRARTAAMKAARLELEREFATATAEDWVRFFESGLYPSEAGASPPQPQEPVPFESLGIPEIRLEDAFDPRKMGN